jgi:hypothetical protein
MEKYYEPLYLHKRSLIQYMVMDICTIFIWNIILFYEAFKNGDNAKYWGYVCTNPEPVCVEFCNFAQCYLSLNYLTLC